MDDADVIKGWLTGRVPREWVAGGKEAEVRVDREEIVVVVPLPDAPVPEGASDEAAAAARAGWVKQFRESTRAERVHIAREAEHRFRRKLSWGAETSGHRELFTTFGAPVMTRLRMDQREVLDALVAAGVARSRSHALDWCVRLVARHQGEWITELKEALVHVERVRSAGPEIG